MRSDDDPDGAVYEAMSSLAFKASPYRWPIIGWMADIERIDATELRAFYDTYYRPNNAVLIVLCLLFVGALIAYFVMARG